MRSDSLGPFVNVVWTAHDKADMVDSLYGSRFAAGGQLMQSEIVLTGGQIGVLFVGHPF